MFATIIIPMRNEEKFVGGCLDSLLSQIKGGDNFEILCVDGMSTDRTRQIVGEYANRDSRIRLMENPHKIVPTALNLGISQSQGDFILLVGCHSEYAPDYIGKCMEVLERTSADVVGGYLTTLPGKNTAVGRAIVAATGSRFGVGDSKFRLTGPEQEADTVPFGAYRKAIFDRVGLFDERLSRNQDIEMNSRIRKAGGRIIISPDIKLSYYNRGTYRGLWQQAFNNGLWNPYTIWLVGGGLSLRHFVPLFFVSGLIAFLISAFFWSPFMWMFFGYLLFYLLIGSVFAVRCAYQARVSAFFVLLSFLVLHIAYGLGSLWGSITMPFKFPHRYKKFIGKPLADRKI